MIVYCKVDKGGVHKPVFHGAGVNISGHFWNVELWRSRWWVTWCSILIKQRRGSIHIQNVTKTQMPLRKKNQLFPTQWKNSQTPTIDFSILYSWAILTSWGEHSAILCASRQIQNYIKLNSQAVGWNSWVPTALKSIFWGDLIFESAVWFFVIILKFIFTPIFKIIMHEKNSLTPKKFHFRRPFFINQHRYN